MVWVVGVGVRRVFHLGSRVSSGDVCWRVCWGLLISGGVVVGACSICVSVLVCGVCPRRYGLGVRLRGGILARVHFVDVVVIGESGCDLLGLLEA